MPYRHVVSSPERLPRAITVGVPAGLLLLGSAVPLPPGRTPDFGWFGPDKLLHLAGHAWLTAALVRAVAPDDGTTCGGAALAVALSVGYGLATERLQEAVPGREFERADVVAGLLGSLLGVAVRHRALGWR